MTPLPPAILLSGGLSSRMGTPKALAQWGEHRLIDHVARTILPQIGSMVVSSNDPTIALAGIPSVSDRIKGFAGPLAGIEAGLAALEPLAAPHTHALVVPVDCPFLPEDLVSTLLAANPGPSAIVIARSRGQRHPVIGLWPFALRQALHSWLQNDENRKVGAFLAEHETILVDFDDRMIDGQAVDPFFNINTPAELDDARARLAGTTL